MKTNLDIIDQDSYECGYSSGYTDGMDYGYEIGYSKCMMKIKKMMQGRNRRVLYSAYQKLFGAFLLILTAIIVAILADATIALFTVPIGLILIFSKKEWLYSTITEGFDYER